MSRRRIALLSVLGLLGCLALAIGALALALRHPRPQGQAGPAADALARAIERAVDVEAWKRTGAVRWRYAGRHEHLWDRARGLARVRWPGAEVLLDLGKQDGRAYVDGREVSGRKREKLVKRAYAAWVNDSFWLNPLGKLFDPGTERLLVERPGAERALLIQYRSGGLTPGDAYLWLPGEGGRPRAWQLFVKILPIDGLEFTWDRWTRLRTGAWISTEHKLAGRLSISIGDLDGAATLGELLPGPDPFAALSP